MKLRTKIICISSVVILLALLVSNLLIHRICSDTMLDEATNAAYIESNEVKNNFEQFLSQLKGNIGVTEVEYYFKTERDDYTICIKSGVEYYNNTVLTPEDITSGEYKNHLELSYKEHSVYGRNILIFKLTTSAGMELYHIVDITHVYDRINTLAVAMLCISAAVIIISIAVLSVVVKRTLSPLGELSKGAKSIADGAYDKRVAIKTHDEVGTLAKDFNTMAEAVERHTRELEESEERKTLFMGNLTHELKTPLTAISGYAQTMRAVELSEDDRDEALTYIYEETGRLDRLAKKMMRLLELDRDTEIAIVEISLDKLFEAAVRTCTVSANEKGITLKIGDCNGTIQGDFDLMCDVIINLIDNAIKASPEGASINLYTEDGAIVVEDFGCGIPESEIARITEPFYMVDKSRSRKSGGAGLGLALTKLILNHHGMEMCVESEVGKGTKIAVYKSFATR